MGVKTYDIICGKDVSDIDFKFCLLQADFGLKTAWKWPEIFLLKYKHVGVKTYEIICGKDVSDTIFTFCLLQAWKLLLKVKTYGTRVLKHMKSNVERTFLTRFLSFCLLQPDFGLKNAWNIALIYIFFNYRHMDVKAYIIICGKDVSDTIFKFFTTSGWFWPEVVK